MNEDIRVQPTPQQRLRDFEFGELQWDGKRCTEDRHRVKKVKKRRERDM